VFDLTPNNFFRVLFGVLATTFPPFPVGSCTGAEYLEVYEFNNLASFVVGQLARDLLHAQGHQLSLVIY